MTAAGEGLKRLAVGADGLDGIAIVLGDANHADSEVAVTPAAANAGVKDSGIRLRVAADQQNGISLVDGRKRCIEKVACAAMIGTDGLAGRPAIHALCTEAREHFLEREHFFAARQIAGNRANLFGGSRRQLLGGRGQRFVPADRLEASVAAQIRAVEALGSEAVGDVAGLVGDPLFVDVVVGAGQDAHDLGSRGNRRGWQRPSRPSRQSIRSYAVPTDACCWPRGDG